MSADPVESSPAESKEDNWASIKAQYERDTEHSRMQAVLRLQEWEELTPEAIEMLRDLSEGEHRSIRNAARDVLKNHGHDLVTADTNRLVEARAEGRSKALLAIISLGSTGTGVLITALSFLSYYTMGRFPFPEPLAVLFWTNTLFTLPFIAVAALMIFPGSGPKAVAGILALVSLIGCTVLMMSAESLFEAYWSFQFTDQKAADYKAFLSPFRVGFMLLPIIVGQSLLLFYISYNRVVPTKG